VTATARWTRRWPAFPPWTVDLLLVALALADAVLNTNVFDADADTSDVIAFAASVAAAGALVLRRRFPFLTFLCTVPGLILSDADIASLVALYSMARYGSKPVPLIVGTVVVFAGYSALWQPPYTAHVVLLNSIYGALFAAAPLALGLLVRTRRELSTRIAEVEQAREHERERTAQHVLARERAQLAREMHDVVSHQVSLIAVQAGALQMANPDPDTRRAARTIRELSVTTLDELRQMVSVLRADGGRSTELFPQPGLRDLEQLTAASGIPTTMSIDPRLEAAPPLQRAVYRTVQEALTNVRKHAPGATATVSIARDADQIVASVLNTAASHRVTPLPSAQHGLIGLHERAELLGGTLTTGPTPAGGFHLELRLPNR
jgi:signal transduction histidine kinase